MAKKPKRPRDTNQLAKFITDLVTGQTTKSNPDDGKNPNAMELGRKGGQAGGPARAAKLTKEQRREIAQKAARKRWGNK